MELKQVKRITIVGGPGTGKTTLAQKLGTIFNLPIIHIDGINYNPNWEKVEKEKRDKLILEKIKNEKWISDGNYSSTLKERIEKSDLIIWLDYSGFDSIKGVLSRRIKNFNKKNKKFLGAKKESVGSFFNMWLHIEEKREIKL